MSSTVVFNSSYISFTSNIEAFVISSSETPLGKTYTSPAVGTPSLIYDVLVISTNIDIICKSELFCIRFFILSETSSVESVNTIMYFFTVFFESIGVVNVLQALSKPTLLSLPSPSFKALI